MGGGFRTPGAADGGVSAPRARRTAGLPRPARRTTGKPAPERSRRRRPPHPRPGAHRVPTPHTTDNGQAHTPSTTDDEGPGPGGSSRLCRLGVLQGRRGLPRGPPGRPHGLPCGSVRVHEAALRRAAAGSVPAGTTSHQCTGPRGRLVSLGPGARGPSHGCVVPVPVAGDRAGVFTGAARQGGPVRAEGAQGLSCGPCRTRGSRFHVGRAPAAPPIHVAGHVAPDPRQAAHARAPGPTAVPRLRARGPARHPA